MVGYVLTSLLKSLLLPHMEPPVCKIKMYQIQLIKQANSKNRHPNPALVVIKVRLRYPNVFGKGRSIASSFPISLTNNIMQKNSNAPQTDLSGYDFATAMNSIHSIMHCVRQYFGGI